jgi:CxxC-x17-CxxC domain-containing protein
MGNFRPEGKGRSGGGSRSRDSRFGGRRSGGFGRDRRPVEMHEVTCTKCGKQCEVPFKPTGDKPVYCSDCFRAEGGGSNRNSDRSSRSGSSDQLDKINAKLDKILGILENAKVEELPEDEKESEDEAE